MNLYFPSQSTSLDATNQTGNWLLETGRAITVTSRSGGQLQVARGRVWATLGSEHSQPWRAAPLEPCATLQDYFLSAGDTLHVPPGAKVVIESMCRAQSLPVAFAWSHAPQAHRQTRVGVVQAANELRLALGQVLQAARRLVGAVVLGPKPEQRLKTCL